MEYRVLGIDPGGTTGIFHACFREGEPPAVVRDQWDWNDIVRRLPEWLGSVRGPHAVVAERFTITARTAKLTQQTTALEVIGVVHFLCDRHHIPFTLQSKANVVKLGSDDVLKSIPTSDGRTWYSPANGHANDAARHVLGHLATTRPDILETLI